MGVHPPTPCSQCGTETTSRGGWIDQYTLRRRIIPLCIKCAITPNPHQDALRRERSQQDWKRVTDPIQSDTIVPGEMPEQYPSHVRAALRAFVDSDSTEALVPGCTLGVLQASIMSLGLQYDIYAEQRSGVAVLRKVRP